MFNDLEQNVLEDFLQDDFAEVEAKHNLKNVFERNPEVLQECLTLCIEEDEEKFWPLLEFLEATISTKEDYKFNFDKLYHEVVVKIIDNDKDLLLEEVLSKSKVLPQENSDHLIKACQKSERPFL